MKIWIVPFPFDWWKEGEILVRANTPGEALEKARGHIMKERPDLLRFVGLRFVMPPGDGKDHEPRFVPETPTEWTGDIYVNWGDDE